MVVDVGHFLSTAITLSAGRQNIHRLKLIQVVLIGSQSLNYDCIASCHISLSYISSSREKYSDIEWCLSLLYHTGQKMSFKILYLPYHLTKL